MQQQPIKVPPRTSVRALGWLCKTPMGTRIFPLCVRVMCPNTKDTSLSVLKQICAKVPPGLIIFDRGFNRRKVFEAILSQGHHLLCRAKSNAVFYQIPPTPKKQKRGRPVRYGNRINLSRLQFEVEAVLRTLGIHWYKPKYITRGLIVAYLQKQIQQQGFSTSYDPTQNSQKNTKILEN